MAVENEFLNQLDVSIENLLKSKYFAKLFLK
jgi:hypothetical protein